MEIKRFITAMRKRGAVCVNVGDVTVTFPSERLFSTLSADRILKLRDQAREEATSPTPPDTEVHSLEEDEPQEAQIAGPFSSTLPDDRALDDDTDRFETWYHTAPKPTSFAR